MGRPLKDALNEANPNRLAVACQKARLGDALNGITAFYVGPVTGDVLTLPEGRKALAVARAFARAGGAPGWKVPGSPSAAPAAGQCRADGAGNVEFAAADAVSEAEVWYVVAEGEVVEEDLQATVAGEVSLTGNRRAMVLLEAEVLTGAGAGAKTVQVRGAAPAAGEAAINAAGDRVLFLAGELAAGERARVKYIAQPGQGEAKKGLHQLLEESQDI